MIYYLDEKREGFFTKEQIEEFKKESNDPILIVENVDLEKKTITVKRL